MVAQAGLNPGGTGGVGAGMTGAVRMIFLAGRRLALVARGENVLDAAVVTRNSAGSIDLGTPRTWWIGLRLR